MINVGIIGLGHVAKHQIDAIDRCRDFRLVAGCDPAMSRLTFPDNSIPIFGEVEEMLEFPDLDVVVVASPNRLHVSHGIQVMASGRWLFMEKPLAESTEEFERFEQKKQSLGGNCTLALHAAFGVDVEWFCENRRDREFKGLEIESFRASFDDPYIEDGRLLLQAESLGGSWMDSGINALSVICRLLEIEGLTVANARMTRNSDMKCLETEGHVELEFMQPSGPGRGEISTSWLAGRNRKVTTLRFRGSDKVLTLDHSGQRVLLSERGGERLLFACSNELPRLTNHYIGAFANLASQIKSGKDNFRYCQHLHRLHLGAEYWDRR